VGEDSPVRQSDEDKKILESAVRILLVRLQYRTEETSLLEKVISCIQQEVTQEPVWIGYSKCLTPLTRRGLRKDLFYGKPLATAVQQYLELRDEAMGVEEILAGLWEGGFDVVVLGPNAEERLSNLTLSLGKNTKTFHRLPNNAFGLLLWYSEDPSRAIPQSSKRRRNRKHPGSSDSTPSEA
jgi:hypothetical protein